MSNEAMEVFRAAAVAAGAELCRELAESNKALLARAETAEAALAEARKDSERLDWLIKSLNIRYPYYASGDAAQARDGIDAARAEGMEQP